MVGGLSLYGKTWDLPQFVKVRRVAEPLHGPLFEGGDVEDADARRGRMERGVGEAGLIEPDPPGDEVDYGAPVGDDECGSILHRMKLIHYSLDPTVEPPPRLRLGVGLPIHYGIRGGAVQVLNLRLSPVGRHAVVNLSEALRGDRLDSNLPADDLGCLVGPLEVAAVEREIDPL